MNHSEGSSHLVGVREDDGDVSGDDFRVWFLTWVVEEWPDDQILDS